ncbi:putative chloride channel protein [Trypanosoma conorhini]|uniref:Chloride channel protein n=1 Tax=Trypanosoma conorhini TaxID=83891 RepID=A0A422QC63_9TRYP|nr:putative chloride channel protein [Trypanosoma conorhini]RNF27570.1 putative chloride channel protein [Trypanosoma conorhini]
MSRESMGHRSVAGSSASSSRGAGRDNPLHSLRGLSRDRGTNAWFQELAQEAEDEGDAAFFRLRAPLFEQSARPHVFSAEERRRMDNYESIDYGEAQSLTYKARMLNRKQERRWLKWIMFIAVGVCVGLWSVLLLQTLDFLSTQKLSLLERYINARVDKSASENETDLFGLTPGGVRWSDVGRGYLIYLLWSGLAALLSSLCCLIVPSAAGSGVPDVMAYLNGIMFPRIFNIRNLVVKTLSCILAVGSGLPVGAEGPIIHIGSLIGAGLPTGRSRTLRCSAGSLLSTFQNPRDMRDFISAGAACGMTSAFSAPIGGMLFVMEEMATFFPVRLACLVFVSCLSCMCVIQIINTYLVGWQVPARLPVATGAGEFRPYAISMFIVDVVKGNRVPMNLLTFIPTIVGAIVLGLLAVSYTVSSVKFTRWRSKRLFPSTLLRVLEPCMCALVYATACYGIPLAFGCVEVPEYVKAHKEELSIELFTAFCADRENTFSPLGTLALTSPYNGIRLLFSRHTVAVTPWYACLLHLLLYTLGSSYAGGMFISCGTVIPSLFIGAVGGRLIGVLFNNSVWADPGVMALIGSAAYFSGISRLSFSLIVIMMELTSDLTHITCLMVGVILARAVADRFCHSLYHSLLEVKAAPFLEIQASVHKLDMFCAKDIMTAPAVTLATVETVAHLVETLQSTPHNSFPVVLTEKGTYDGVISRSQLELLLWFIYFRDVERGEGGEAGASSRSCAPSDDAARGSGGRQHEGLLTVADEEEGGEAGGRESGAAAAAAMSAAEALTRRLERQPHATYVDLREVSERIFWRRLPPLPPVELLPAATVRCFVDLSPYVDLSAYYVRDLMCISRTYHIFRHLGLRQLPVVDRNHRVIGVISRKNFVSDRLHERLHEAEEVAKRTARDRAQRLYRKCL